MKHNNGLERENNTQNLNVCPVLRSESESIWDKTTQIVTITSGGLGSQKIDLFLVKKPLQNKVSLL